MDPGKPRYPLNVGTPPFDLMYFSAKVSNSFVVTPGLTSAAQHVRDSP